MPSSSEATPDNDAASSIALRPFRLAAAFWVGRQRWFAWWLSIALVLLTLAQVGIPIALNVWNQRLFDALEQRDFDQLLRQVGVAVLIIVGSMIIMTVHLRFKRRLQVEWRADLTNRLLNEWMVNGRQYQLSQIPGQHDNPDGRIAEDIRIATEYTVDLTHSLLYCVLLLFSFTQILWSLSGPPLVNLGDWSVYLPGHLVWIALLYASAGAAAATLLGRPLVRAANYRQDKEADFRFGLVQAREKALTIALGSAESRERREMGHFFDNVVGAWRRQTRALANLFMFSSSWTVMTQAFPVLVAAPRYIAGAITLGGLMQTAQAFQQMIAALSWPVDNMQKLAECRASILRVAHLHHSLTKITSPAKVDEASAIVVATGARERLVIEHLSLRSPDGKVLLEDFNASINPGERVLIDGDPQTALKLFRAIAGIWPWGDGRIWLPAGDALYFLPRRSRLGRCPLREAIVDSSSNLKPSDTALNTALSMVGLEDLVPRMNESADWSEELSGPERQRLGFARILLQRPHWIFMRQATSDLDAAEAAQLFDLVGRILPHATIVATGHDLARALDGSRLIELPMTAPAD